VTPPAGLTGIALEAWADKQAEAQGPCPYCGSRLCLGTHIDCMTTRFDPKNREEASR